MLFFRKGEINAFSDKNLLPCKKCLKKSFREKEKDTGQNSEKERKSTRECISESKKKKKKNLLFFLFLIALTDSSLFKTIVATIYLMACA